MSNSFLTKWRGELELMTVVLMWGLNFPIMKIVLVVLHPYVLNVLRILSAGIVLGYIYWVRSGRSVQVMWQPMHIHGWAIARLGFVGWVCYQLTFILGLDMTSAGNAALIMASAPLWTALVARSTRVERLTILAWTGLVISIAGTIWVVLYGSTTVELASQAMTGNLIILVAAMLWGSYTALTRPLVQHMSPTALTVLALAVAFPVLFLFAVPVVGDVAWHDVHWWHWLLVFTSGSLSTGIAIVLWNRGVRTIGPSHTAAFNNLVPFVALFSSWLILGDPASPGQILGGGLIVGGLVLMRKARATPRTVPPRVH